VDPERQGRVLQIYESHQKHRSVIETRLASQLHRPNSRLLLKKKYQPRGQGHTTYHWENDLRGYGDLAPWQYRSQIYGNHMARADPPRRRPAAVPRPPPPQELAPVVRRVGVDPPPVVETRESLKWEPRRSNSELGDQGIRIRRGRSLKKLSVMQGEEDSP
jgi:hypothetical protein